MGFIEAILGDSPAQWIFIGIIGFLIIRSMSNKGNGNGNSSSNSSNSGNSNSTPSAS